MNVIKAYKSEDGTIFESEQKCIEHETHAALKINIEAFVNEYFTSDMHVWTIAETILDEREELLKILRGE